MTTKPAIFWDPHQPIDTASIATGETSGLAALRQKSVNVVIPATYASYQLVNLAKIPKPHRPQAIPSLLEEDCLQDIATQTFAWVPLASGEKTHVVMVLNKALVQDIVQTLASHDITVDRITTDLLLPSANQAFIGPTHTNLCLDDQIGGLETSLLTTLIPKLKAIETWHCFSDSAPAILEALQEGAVPCQSHTMTFRDFYHAQFARMTLPQLELSNPTSPSRHKQIRWATAGLLTIAVLGWLATSGLNLWRLNHANRQLARQNLALFQQFFPQAKRLISPKFQIEQKLKAMGQTQTSDAIRRLKLILLTISHSAVSLERLHYHHLRFDLYLSANNADALAALNKSLTAASLAVKPMETQTQAGGFQAHWQIS